MKRIALLLTVATFAHLTAGDALAGKKRSARKPRIATSAPRTIAVAPLTPDDVIAQAARARTGTQRCYQRALKADPFLSVPSLGALIVVDAAGRVTEVRVDASGSKSLDRCLRSAIERWAFHPSADGIAAHVKFAFVRN